MGDNFRAAREESQKRRARNRAGGANALREAGIAYTFHNGGAHLVVDRRGGRVDYWPGTGKWIDHQRKRAGRGVRSLIAWVCDHEHEGEGGR